MMVVSLIYHTHFTEPKKPHKINEKETRK